MLVYIKDIIDSMNLVEKYVEGLSYENFEENIAIQDSIMRRFEIIGEAVSRLTSEFKHQYPEIPWRSMIGLRNIIIHDYSSVNLKEVWRISTVDILKTKIDIEKILKL